MQNDLACRPCTSFSVHFRKVPKTDSPKSPKLQPVKAVQSIAEIEEIIQIRPLTISALSASENNTPLKYFKESGNKSPSRTTNSMNSNELASNPTRILRGCYRINGLNSNSPAKSRNLRMKMKEKNYKQNTDWELKNTQKKVLKIIADLRAERLKAKAKGKILRGTCTYITTPGVSRIIHNIKLSI